MGYGYSTDVVFGATLPLFQGLRRGDIHVSLEIWLPNQIEAWYEAEANGEVVETLGAWGLRIGPYPEVAAWLDENSSASSNEAALWWLSGNGDIWRGWVSDDAPDAIEAALAANEIPDGWPVE